MMEIVNPATEQTIETVQEDNRESIESKLGLCRIAQKKWGELPVRDRIEIISSFQALLIQNQDHLALTLTQEMGKPIVQSKSEIQGACDRIGFFLEEFGILVK